MMFVYNKVYCIKFKYHILIASNIKISKSKYYICANYNYCNFIINLQNKYY